MTVNCFLAFDRDVGLNSNFYSFCQLCLRYFGLCIIGAKDVLKISQHSLHDILQKLG